MTKGKGPYEYPGCDWCSHPKESCPYWYRDMNGDWQHDESGQSRYTDEVIYYTSPDIADDLPTTNEREKKKRGWW